MKNFEQTVLKTGFVQVQKFAYVWICLNLRDQAARIYKRFIEFIGLCVPKPEIAPNRQRAATKTGGDII